MVKKSFNNNGQQGTNAAQPIETGKIEINII